MSDDQNKNPDPGSPDPGSPNSGSADPGSSESDPLSEIGELLAEAEALTSELSEEIGEEPPSQFEDPDYFGDETDVEATTELHMQEAEHALNEATEELGGEKKKTPGKGLKLPPAKSISLPKKSDTATSDSASSKSESPKSKSSISLPAAGAATKTESLVAAKTTEPAIEVKEPSRRVAELNKKFAMMCERLEPVTRAVCVVLELLDRPFTRIQLRLRVVLGWLAIVLFVAAFSLWLFAL